MLGLTAVYAAVLVVFVGTNTTQNGLSNKKVGIVTGSLLSGLAILTPFVLGVFHQIQGAVLACHIIQRKLLVGNTEHDESI